MIGKTIRHYKILEKVGSGGMGDVYMAEDTKLKRPVALKFLPPQFTRDSEAKKRFIKEAQAASALQHNNICTIYEINETEDGQLYIAMEYLAGKTLKERIEEGKLTVEESLDVATQLARGLEKAHKKGIIHRDIKPANIIVTEDGTVKIVDFGLAKLAGRTLLTKEGTTLGTVAYMSPEQTQGTDVDHRTDIWALGVILYEILTGERPFKGDYEQAVVYSILNEEPDPITDLRPEIPMSLGQVVSKALEKNPDKRYQNTEELLDDLKSISAGIVPDEIKARLRKAKLHKRKRVISYTAIAGLIIIMTFLALHLFTGRAEAIESIAVLPLENLTGNDEKEYFVDGATDELIGQLSQIGALRVISRRSVMQYKGTDKPLPEIARELNVDAVVEGSVHEIGEKVRIQVRLIDALPRERTLWTHTYERALTDVLVMYSEMARTIADTTQVKLTDEEITLLTRARQVNPEAHEAYLKGSYHWKKLTKEDLDTAERYFELALEKDQTYAPAYEGLAWVWSSRQQRGYTPPHEAGPKVKAAALQAIALDDGSAGAHEALALARTWTEWDWAGAEPEWRRTLELDPNAANAHAFFAQFLAITGCIDEAIPHSERAIELDPFNALFHGLYAMVLYGDRRYDDAMAAARTAQAMQPRLEVARGVIRYVFISKGMWDEQLADQRERIAHDSERVAAFEQGLAEAGYEGAMRSSADLLAARYEKSGGIPAPGVRRVYMPKHIALRYLDAGDYNRSIDWLERAFEVRDPNLPYIGFQPLWDPLRSDSRFQDLLRRMGLPLHEKK